MEDKIVQEYLTIKGGDFPKWWTSLSENDKEILIERFGWNG
jgi:hypothetical protein